MDGSGFDDLARRIGRRLTRREWIAAAGAAIVFGRSNVEAAACREQGVTCREHANCCSGLCSPKDARGRRLCGSVCTPNGGTCISGEECCNRSCYRGACELVPTGQLCTTDPECSSGNCQLYDNGSYCTANSVGGTCQVNDDCIGANCAAGTCACSPANGTCGQASDCCSGPCYQGTCRYIPTGQLCTVDEECSSRNCDQVTSEGSECSPNGFNGFCRVDADCVSGSCVEIPGFCTT